MITKARLESMGMSSKDAEEIMMELETERRFRELATAAGMHEKFVTLAYKAEERSLLAGKWDLSDRPTCVQMIKSAYNEYCK